MTQPMTLQAARAALAKGREALGITLKALVERCVVDGRVSISALDNEQLVCYDTAFNASELACGDAVVDYAHALCEQRRADDLPLEAHFAGVFVAEALHNIRGRVLARLADFGLSSAQFAETLGSDAVTAYCDQQLSAAHLTCVGESLIRANGSIGAYQLTEQHEMLRTTFRQFANDVVMPLAEKIHRHDLLIPDEILKPLTEMGCFGLSIPEAYGGFHEDNMGMIVVTEELSRGSLGAAGSLITRPEILARALLAGGTEVQKQNWLPKLAAGDPLCAVAVTEPDFGSDVANMKFKASKCDGGWLLNGAKTWCTFGGKAGVLLVLARTNPDPAAGHKGLSVFLVEKPASEGHDFEVTQSDGGSLSGRAIATIGYRGMHSYECFFENFKVPESALLGGEKGLGRGFYYVMDGFSGGRIQTAARAIGVMQAAFEVGYRYATERKVFQIPIANYQLTQVKLARMAAWLCASRQFTYAVARLMDTGGGQVEASMVKLLASRTAEWLTRESQQIHGGMGYAEETAVSRYFLDARVLSIFEGVEEILALRVIARSLIEANKR